MARKNIFGTDDERTSAAATVDEAVDSIRPLANFEKPLKRTGPVGAISQSLGGINEKAQRAAELERQLAQGQAIVELDPELIDNSFVPDRLGVTAADQDMLISQIREHGQQVPILVRPHPDGNGRYQVAYGHRRLAALKRLGTRVKAVVRELTDDQLVVSQGQENNARTDLSFIERAFFGFRLEKRGFSRDIIMSALGVDKAALSRMIALIERVPTSVIEAIGPAPGYGRARWAEMAEFLVDRHNRERAHKLVTTQKFLDKGSDERFDYLFQQFQTARQKPRTSAWANDRSRNAVRISETDDRLSLVFDKSASAGFGAFIESKLGALYDEFLKNQSLGD